jgi:hypothetical protein
MCENTHEYNEFPPRTIGGPSGDYEIMCDVTSAETVEYSVVSVAGGDAGPYTVIASGNQKPATLLFTGTQIFGGANQSHIGHFEIDGMVLHSPGISSIPAPERWLPLANQQRKVLIRIDTPGGTSAFVTIQLRDKVLKRIPQPFITVHPEEMEQYHAERERRIQQSVYGEEGELEVYGHKGVAGGVRVLTTGERPTGAGQQQFKRK